MLAKNLFIIPLLAASMSVHSATQQDINYATSQLQQAESRRDQAQALLDKAEEQFDNAQNEVTIQKAAVERAREEVATLRKLLSIYQRDQSQGTEGEKEQSDTYKSVLRSIHVKLQEAWRIPSTARNGMKAVVSIHLLPNGAVDQVFISSSSGHAAFDNSAVQAVYRVQRFPSVADIDHITFERKLKKIHITFAPTGLP